MQFHTSIRFGSRPNYGSESSRKPNGYDSSVSGEYGYVNNGYGGYSFNRPTSYGGSVSGGGSYGISETFANGEEFGPVEPNHPEGHAPSHPNIQAQKVMIKFAANLLVHLSYLLRYYRLLSFASGCSFKSIGRCCVNWCSCCFSNESRSSSAWSCIGKEETIECQRQRCLYELYFSKPKK